MKFLKRWKIIRNEQYEEMQKEIKELRKYRDFLDKLVGDKIENMAQNKGFQVIRCSPKTISIYGPAEKEIPAKLAMDLLNEICELPYTPIRRVDKKTIEVINGWSFGFLNVNMIQGDKLELTIKGVG